MLRKFIIAAGAVLSCQQALGAPIIYDLADDWSDFSNPNGTWTYTGNNGAVLAVNQLDWDPGSTIFGSNQRAWADSIFPNASHVPMWFQRTADSTQLDIAMGGVGMHGAEGNLDAWVGVYWTSPTAGVVDVSGAVWQALKVVNDGVGGNHQVRSSDWRITLNGIELTGGTISGGDAFTSAAPLSLLAGSGGAAAISGLVVSMNDIISLEFISPRSFATFNGVDFTISLEERTTVVEPGALGLFFLGLSLVAVRKRRIPKRGPVSACTD